jgi:hypothetical protein
MSSDWLHRETAAYYLCASERERARDNYDWHTARGKKKHKNARATPQKQNARSATPAFRVRKGHVEIYAQLLASQIASWKGRIVAQAR